MAIEDLVLCGLGVPLLRLLWSAIQNRQLYILRTYCKSGITVEKMLAFYSKGKIPALTIFSNVPFFLMITRIDGFLFTRVTFFTPCVAQIHSHHQVHSHHVCLDHCPAAPPAYISSWLHTYNCQCKFFGGAIFCGNISTQGSIADEGKEDGW